MLLYTSFPTDVFNIIDQILKRMAPFNFYDEWEVNSFSLEDQLLMVDASSDHVQGGRRSEYLYLITSGSNNK